MRHFLTLSELKPAEMEQVFAISEDLKSKFQQGKREPLLPGRVMALLFEKPSLRTRASFEAAMAHLGGTVMFLGAEAGFRSRETVEDFVRVLSQYVDVIVARTFSHATVEELAKHSYCSIINGLSDSSHPCQALADLFTLRERIGRLRGHKLAYIGDGNNVARSLASGCATAGMKFTLAAPEKYQFDPAYVQSLKKRVPDADIVQTSDPAEAVRDAVAVYTDVWTSMGQEQEAQQRRSDLKDYQVNQALMSKAPAHAYFMHCLPAHRGEEVTDAVLDGPQSIVVAQAGNRMHAQKGLLAWLLASQH